MSNSGLQLLAIFPLHLRKEISKINFSELQEVRLRIQGPSETVLANKIHKLEQNVSQEDLNFVLNMASRYSPWTASSLSKGYLTAPGGHRIGVCGDVIIKGNQISGFSRITSLCIRMAKDLQQISPDLKHFTDSFIIIGAPGWGKTTLLRDISRCLAEYENICVIDEREELFPESFKRGKHMDVLTGCPKQLGMEMLIRTMSPDWIAVDEITAEADCTSLAYAANCGVKLAATAHASSLREFMVRPAYQTLRKMEIFKVCLILSKNKTFKMERILSCTTNGLGQLL